MKKALQISLAHTLFTVEEDAYSVIDTYLQSIRAHFSHTEGSDEIISDIESRMSEQFTETGKVIITREDAERVMSSIGKVEDFAGDNAEKANEDSTAPEPAAKKKFYRNPDDKIISGVCSGIAAYLDVDVLWVRVSFVVLTIITNGFGIIAYILLAVLTPEAKSASQKLEMAGDPVTLETMSENVKEKMETVRTTHGSTIRSVIAWPFGVLRTVMQSAGPIFRVTISALIAALSLASILGLSFLVPIILTHGNELTDFPLSTIIPFPVLLMTIIGVYVALVIPLAVLFLLAIGTATKKRIIRSTLGFSLLCVWCIGIVTGSIGVFNAANSFEEYTRNNPLYENITTEISISDTITAVTSDNGINVTYIQGDTPRLTVTGRTTTIQQLQVGESYGEITLERNPSKRFCVFCRTGTIEAVITLPTLERVTASSGSRFEARAWTSAVPVTLDISGGSGGYVNVIAPEVLAAVHQGSYLTLTSTAQILTLDVFQGSDARLLGTVQSANIHADQGSSVDATGAALNTVTATAEQGSHVTLGEVQSLAAYANGGSIIEYASARTITQEVDSGSSVEQRPYERTEY